MAGGQAGSLEGTGPAWLGTGPQGWAGALPQHFPSQLPANLRAPPRTSLQIHSLAAVYSGHGTQMSAAITAAVQLPPVLRGM